MLATYHICEIKEKRFHLAIARKFALPNYSPHPHTAAVDAKRDAGSIRQPHEKGKKISDEFKARDGDGLLALAESSRKRCQRLVLLKGERLRIWPYLHLRLQRDPWTISKECRLTDCTSVRSLACRICLWHFLGSES